MIELEMFDDPWPICIRLSAILSVTVVEEGRGLFIRNTYGGFWTVKNRAGGRLGGDYGRLLAELRGQSQGDQP